MPRYVQAWQINGGPYIYDQKLAVSKLSEAPDGAEMKSVTIVRHENGGREYLPGTIASEVQKYRESL